MALARVRTRQRDRQELSGRRSNEHFFERKVKRTTKKKPHEARRLARILGHGRGSVWHAHEAAIAIAQDNQLGPQPLNFVCESFSFNPPPAAHRRQGHQQEIVHAMRVVGASWLAFVVIEFERSITRIYIAHVRVADPHGAFRPAHVTILFVPVFDMKLQGFGAPPIALLQLRISTTLTPSPQRLPTGFRGGKVGGVSWVSENGRRDWFRRNRCRLDRDWFAGSRKSIAPLARAVRSWHPAKRVPPTRWGVEVLHRKQLAKSRDPRGFFACI
jgi:hypothetical protein